MMDNIGPYILLAFAIVMYGGGIVLFERRFGSHYKGDNETF